MAERQTSLNDDFGEDSDSEKPAGWEVDSDSDGETTDDSTRSATDSGQTTLLGDFEEGPEFTTELVNVSTYGREGVRMIDRTTEFGNPFRLENDGGEYTREESVERYREWFVDEVDSNPEFREAVEDLRGETLGCWCKPKSCHGDVILAYLRGELDVETG